MMDRSVNRWSLLNVSSAWDNVYFYYKKSITQVFSSVIYSGSITVEPQNVVIEIVNLFNIKQSVRPR